MIATPLHTGAINGFPVRFFRSPLNDGRPDLPWVAWDDLAAAFPLLTGMVENFRRHLRANWPEASRTIATTTGPTVLVPHFAAQGFIGAMDECLGMNAKGDYTKAGAESLMRLTENLNFADLMLFARDFMRRWDGGANG